MYAPDWHPEASHYRSIAEPSQSPQLVACETRWPWRGWALFILGCVAAIVIVSVVIQPNHARLVTYTVGSNDPTGSAFISYRSADGDVSGHLELPWTTTVEVANIPAIYVHADPGTTSVTCSITAANLTLATNTSLGTGAKTTCAVDPHPPNPTHRSHQPGFGRSTNPSPSRTAATSTKPPVT